jgi:hypothetical protein
MSYWHGGDWVNAEQELMEGVALSESIGELRLLMLLKGNLATFLADKATGSQDKPLDGNQARPSIPMASPERETMLDEALRMALENFSSAEALGLLYSRVEARRTLAHVRFRRRELDEAERVCAEAISLVQDTDSKVSRLWLGPVYVETVIALGKRSEAEGKLEESRARHEEAANLAERYSNLTASCQSPRFTREAERLTALVNPT